MELRHEARRIEPFQRLSPKLPVWPHTATRLVTDRFPCRPVRPAHKRENPIQVSYFAPTSSFGIAVAADACGSTGAFAPVDLLTGFFGVPTIFVTGFLAGTLFAIGFAGAAFLDGAGALVVASLTAFFEGRGAFFAGAGDFLAAVIGAAAAAARLLFAHRFFCAAAMRALPSALIVRFPAGVLGGSDDARGRPRRLPSVAGAGVGEERSSRACCRRAISPSIAERM